MRWHHVTLRLWQTHTQFIQWILNILRELEEGKKSEFKCITGVVILISDVYLHFYTFISPLSHHFGQFMFGRFLCINICIRDDDRFRAHIYTTASNAFQINKVLRALFSLFFISRGAQSALFQLFYPARVVEERAIENRAEIIREKETKIPFSNSKNKNLFWIIVVRARERVAEATSQLFPSLFLSHAKKIYICFSYLFISVLSLTIFENLHFKCQRLLLAADADVGRSFFFFYRSSFFLLIKKFHIFFGTASKMIPIDGELLPFCSWRLLWVCNFCTNSIFKWWLCATLCKKKKFTFFFFSESTQNGTN